MNWMKMSMVLATVITISTVALAQGPPDGQVPPASAQRGPRPPKLTPEQRAQQELDKLDAVVHLTPTQRGQLQQMFMNEANQREQNKVAAAGDKEKLKEMNKAAHQQRMAGVKQVLTKDQQKAWHEAKKEMREEHEDMPPPAPRK